MALVRETLKTFDKRERAILMMRFGLDDQTYKTRNKEPPGKAIFGPFRSYAERQTSMVLPTHYPRRSRTAVDALREYLFWSLTTPQESTTVVTFVVTFLEISA